MPKSLSEEKSWAIVHWNKDGKNGKEISEIIGNNNYLLIILFKVSMGKKIKIMECHFCFGIY